MPTFDDPRKDAAEASAALRGLAHATRAFSDPADTYQVIGDLLAGVRSLRQVLDQLAGAQGAHRARAHDDNGNQLAGASSVLAAADELHQAATLLDTVEWRLDAASQHSDRIAWHPARPEPSPSMARLAGSAPTRSPATLAGRSTSEAHRSEAIPPGAWAAGAHLPGMDTTDSAPDASGVSRTTAQAGSLTLTVWPDEPLGEHQRYAYRIYDTATERTVEGRDLFTGAGTPVKPGRAIRELAGFLSATGEARQYALDHPGVTPENTVLFPDDVTEAARVNLDALTLLAEHGPDLAPEQEPTRRWVSVVFLQGAEADEVLDLLDRDGPDAAIEHLAGCDDGDDTVQAALENGYVYDAPPTGMLDRTATRDVYTLVYSPFLGHLNLLREYDAQPDPALLGIDTPTPTTETHSRRHARALRQETADWFSGPTRSPQHGRGLLL